VISKRRNYQILVNSPVTFVPRCTSSNDKTLGLKHLQLPDVTSNSGPPDGAGIVHYGKDELPIEQNTMSDGEVTPWLGEEPATPVCGKLSS
jgi:hypothetical protein